MKILKITSVFFPATGWGGPIPATYDLAKKLVENNCQVKVFTSNAYDYKKNMKIENKVENGLTIQYFNNWSKGLMYFFTPGMISALFRHSKKFDIIHIHSYRQFQDMISFLILCILRKPFVLTSHGYILPEGKGILYKKTYDFFIGKRLLRSAKKIIAFNEKQFLEYQKMGVKKDNIRIIPNTVNIEKLPEKNLFKKKLNISPRNKIVLYLGRIDEEKGVGNLIEAFSRITNNNVHLILAGPDYNFMDKAKKMVKKFNIEKRTHFTGLLNKENKLKAISDADVMVYPSLHEAGISYVILEAAAACKPLIISENIGFAEEVKKYHAGIVLPPTNIEKLSSSIEFLLNNHAEATKMGLNAFEVVKEKFTWDSIIKDYLDVYEEVMKAH